MSQIKQTLPFLNISLLESLKQEIFLSSGGEGWMLSNRLPSDDSLLDNMRIYFQREKAQYQIECILDRVENLFSDITSFGAGDFALRENEYLKDMGEDAPDFDPYRSLEYYLTTDGINDLPDTIERFSELLTFVKTFPARERIMKEAMSKFFGDIEWGYMGTNENGEKVVVSRKDLGAEVVAELDLKDEVNNELGAIEIEYCLDNFNDWFTSIKKMIRELRPFSEMLMLFRK